MPISSRVPSLMERMRKEDKEKLAAARSGEETSSRQQQQQSEAAKEKEKEQLDAAKKKKEKEQLDAAKKKKELEQLDAAKKKKELEQLKAAKEKKKGKEKEQVEADKDKQQVDAAKKREQQLVVAKKKALQREAAKEKEQLEASKEKEQLAQITVDQTLNTKKRSAEEADAAVLEAATAKKAKTAVAASLSHAKDGVPLGENPKLCADWCKGVSNSAQRLSEFKEMDEEEVYEEFATSSIQAMTAMNELFGRLKRSLSRSKTAQSQEAQMKEAMSNAKTAYRKEHEREKHLEEEWQKMKVKRDGAVAELEKVKAEYKDMNLQAAHNERTLNDELNLQKEELDLSHEREKSLRAELENLKVEAAKEQARLRESRDFHVNAHMQVNSILRERCQDRFDKIKSCLEQRKVVEEAAGLYPQAKGVREVLEYLKSQGTLDVPDTQIQDFATREAKYLASYNAVEAIELLPSDLEVPVGSESTPLEAEAGVVAHGSNDGLIDSELADELREPTAPGNDVDAGKE